jgi:hypothetical protein
VIHLTIRLTKTAGTSLLNVYKMSRSGSRLPPLKEVLIRLVKGSVRPTRRVLKPWHFQLACQIRSRGVIIRHSGCTGILRIMALRRESGQAFKNKSVVGVFSRGTGSVRYNVLAFRAVWWAMKAGRRWIRPTIAAMGHRVRKNSDERQELCRPVCPGSSRR